MNEFLFLKNEAARLDKERQLEAEQEQINAYENEAKYLEAQEAKLLCQL